MTSQANEVISGIATKDKGSLDFPLSTVRSDVASFAKKIPNLQFVLDYASRERISNDTTLIEVLTKMREGTSKDWHDLDEKIQTVSISIAALPSLMPFLIEESFVQLDLGMLNMPSVATLLMNDATSKNIYNVWMRSNDQSIDAIRSLYVTDKEAASRQLDALLKKASTVTPNTVQAAVRAGILTKVSGDPRASIRIRICPVCHSVFESLNDKIAFKYILRK